MARTSFLRAKQSTTVGLDFLRWLQGRGRQLEACTQHDIDAYFASGPSTRLHARSLLFWAVNTRRTQGLKIPSGGGKSHPTLGGDARLRALRSLLLNDSLELPWRVAGGLILLLGQKAEWIARLTLDTVCCAPDDTVTIRPASDWLSVPEPFATLVSAYVPRRKNMLTAANVGASWLFPGGMPGQPLDAGYLTCQLKAVGVPVLAGRNSTWHDLVQQAPPSILAETLGISPLTAMKHAERAGTNWQRYAALRP